jgi:hypothetical protein
LGINLYTDALFPHRIPCSTYSKKGSSWVGLAKLCHVAFTAVPIFFFCPTSVSTLWRICLHVHIYDVSRECIWITIATKQHCEWNIFTKIGSGTICWLEIYHWGAGLVVTGSIRDIGQNVLPTGSSSSPSYWNIFFLITLLEETFIINIIILLYIYYIAFFLPWRTKPHGPRPRNCRGFMITLRYTTFGRTPLDEWSAWRRDRYLTTHNTQTRQTSMPPAGFEPTITASERPQNHVFDRQLYSYKMH